MRERVLQIVIKRGKIYARTTYVGLDGKRHAIWRAGRNKTDAKDNLRAALKEMETDEGALVNAKRTFAELADWYTKRYLVAPEFQEDRIVKGKRSYRNEKYLLKAIVAHFGGYKLRSITHGELEKYKHKRLNTKIEFKRKVKTKIVTTFRPRTIASVNRELMVIRAMLRKALKEGWLAHNPFEKRDSLIRMADERRRERTLSYDEETRLLAACASPREHLRPILVCALATGMRLGEILKLEWPDVDFQDRSIRIRSRNTKGLKERIVPITEPLFRELTTLRGLAVPDEPLVFGIESNIKRSFRTACRVAGIPHGGINGLTFHCLRHTAATRMVKQKMGLAEVARILGHSDIKTTYRYVSADSDILDKAREALEFRPPPSSQTSDETTQRGQDSDTKSSDPSCSDQSSLRVGA